MATQTSSLAKDAAKAPINARLSAEEKIHFLREMMRIRRFEQTANKFYNQGKMGGFLHLYTGQESVAVATVSLMEEYDQMITAYRDHGHAIAVGMGMDECMAELFGKAAGCSKGKGGSMHFFDPERKFWGGHGIVAGQTPLGLGIAYALKYKGLPGCCICFLGDGAINQGVFHESLNLAALWDVPVVYIIENNQYSMGTSIERSSAYKGCLAQRAEAYDMEWDRVAGEQFYALREHLFTAMERARKEHRPTVLQVDTYRYYGHSVADANAKKYRPEEEIEFYKQHHDPIQVWENQLVSEEVLTEEEAKALDHEAKKEADASAKFAIDADYPPLEDIYADVYWEVDERTDAGRSGKHFFND